MTRILIFVPTYDELDNAPRMVESLHSLPIVADILFVDDNSPDGTGARLEDMRKTFARLIVHHRQGRLGIGSAHSEAIQWAYDNGYSHLVTLDCDFTHSPADIPRLLEKLSDNTDVVVGSRWAQRHSLPGWNIYRRLITCTGHLLTRFVLGIPQDASGAFRAYRLDRIPRQVFQLIRATGYAFFFESLFVLLKNKVRVAEVGITLPARTYGHSKMSAKAAFRSACYIFELAVKSQLHPERYRLPIRE
jgi:dolichol-phosphate mannosyltransferase